MVFQLIIIQIFIFLALSFVFYKLMISSSYKETLRLKQLNEQNRENAKKIENKKIDAQKHYEKRMADAEKEMIALKDKMTQEVQQSADEIIAQAKQEKDQIIQQAANTREKMREEIEAKMQTKSLVLSCKIIQDILSHRNQQNMHEGFVEEVLEELEGIDQEALTSLKELPANMTERPCHIATPYPLTDAHRKTIKKSLTSKIGHTVTLEEEIDANLIAGIVIKLDNLIIDGSLMTKFNESLKNVTGSSS